jgi:formaldehyde-activating enzyme involved in methanogenesis
MLTLQASGLAAYALAKAVLDRLVAKGFLTDAAAAEIIVSAAREVRRCGDRRAVIQAADQLEATADTYAAKDLGPSVAIRTVRLRRR